jgi:hypothetical protein
VINLECLPVTGMKKGNHTAGNAGEPVIDGSLLNVEHESRRLTVKR